MDEADNAKLLQNAKFVDMSPESVVERINSYRQQVKDFIYQPKKKKKRSRLLILYCTCSNMNC